MEFSTRLSNRQGHSSNQAASSAQAKPRKTGGGGAYGNRFVLSDFAKLLRWRRGAGLLNDAMLLAVLDIVIPRHAQLKTTMTLNAALLKWVTNYVPEIIEAQGAEWVEARRVEIMSRDHGSFPTIDEIAEHLHVTQEEVDGACLCSLRAHDNPKRERTRHNRVRNAERKRECRAQNNAKPQSKSKARTKPWVAMGLSRSAYYEKGLHKAPSADGKDAWTDSSDTVPPGRIRQQQCLDNTGAKDKERDARGDEGMPTRTWIKVEDRDVSEDWRAFMHARRLPEAVDLPF